MLRLFACVFVLLGAVLPFVAGAQEEGKVYRIKNKFSDKVLAPNDSGNLLVQRSVVLKDESNRWKLEKSRQGDFYHIVNVVSGKMLTSPSSAALAQIRLQDGNDSFGQLWVIEPLNQHFTIRSRSSKLYLDVHDFSLDDGAKIIQQTLNKKGGRGNQMWQLVPVN